MLRILVLAAVLFSLPAYAASTIPIGQLTDSYLNSGTVYCSWCLTVSGNSYAAGSRGIQYIVASTEMFGIDPNGQVFIGGGSSGIQFNYRNTGIWLSGNSDKALFGVTHLSFGTSLNPGINNVHLTGKSIGSTSSCGSSPATATNSSDFAGSVTTGSGATGCIIALSETKAAAPFCGVWDQSRAITYSLSTTAITVAGAQAGDVLNWICSDAGPSP